MKEVISYNSFPSKQLCHSLDINIISTAELTNDKLPWVYMPLFEFTSSKAVMHHDVHQWLGSQVCSHGSSTTKCKICHFCIYSLVLWYLTALLPLTQFKPSSYIWIPSSLILHCHYSNLTVHQLTLQKFAKMSNSEIMAFTFCLLLWDNAVLVLVCFQQSHLVKISSCQIEKEWLSQVVLRMSHPKYGSILELSPLIAPDGILMTQGLKPSNLDLTTSLANSSLNHLHGECFVLWVYWHPNQKNRADNLASKVLHFVISWLWSWYKTGIL